MSNDPGFLERILIFVLLSVVWTEVLQWNWWWFLVTYVVIVFFDVLIEAFFGD